MNINFIYDYDYAIWPSITAGPFTVTFSADNNACGQQYELILCAYCSNSYSHFSVEDLTNDHLIPRWRFLDTNYNIISSIPLTTVNTEQGVSGQASFYYIDDMPSIPNPVYLNAEIRNICDTISCCNVDYSEISSAANSIIPIWINEWVPRSIRYTSDGINNITNKWESLPIKWYATLHDVISGDVLSPIIFSYSLSNSAIITTNLITNNLLSSTYTCPETALMRAFDKEDNYGWIRGDSVSNLSSISAIVSGALPVYYENNNIISNKIYISNPNNASLSIINRIPAVLDPILFYNQDQICSFTPFEMISGTGPIFNNISYDMPIQLSTYDNMSLTGIGGIYGIAVCRRFNSEYIWAIDSELDSIYKINEFGNIEKTIELKHVNGELLSFNVLSDSMQVDIPNKTFMYTITTDITNGSSINTEQCMHCKFNISASDMFIDKILAPIKIFFNSYEFNWPLLNCEETIDLQFESTTSLIINISGSIKSEHDSYMFDLVPINYLFNYNIDEIRMCNQLGVTPASIAADSEFNFWISLFDSNAIYKFNTDGEFLTAINYGEDILPYGWNDAVFGQDNEYKPAVVETDVYDNVWVAYNNSNSSYLYKLDSNGVFITSAADFPLSSTPVDMLVDGYDNCLWVSLAFTHYGSAGEIRKYDSNGALLSAITDIYMPSNITIDKQRRIWFIHGQNDVAYIDLSGNKQTFSTIYDQPPAWHLNSPLLVPEEQNLEGIACDNNNVLWVVDSRNNQVYGLNLDLLNTPLSGFDTADIQPNLKEIIYNDSENGQYVVESAYAKSAEAFCDWTGYRWFQKYGTGISETITGTSNVFSIKPFIQPFEMRKFNESKDLSLSMQSYALAPHMAIKYNLWENFIGNAIGKIDLGQQIGRKVYEHIANFPSYNIDIQESNIRQLYSISNYLDAPIDDYNLNYPPDLKRWLNIGSISHSRLWGEIVKCNLNITENKICPRCGYRHTNLNGKIEDPFNYTVTAGIPFVKHDRSIITPEGWTLEYPPMLGYYGREWTTELPEVSADWTIPSLSYDGKYQIIGQYNGYLYCSKDYGSTWIKNESPILSTPKTWTSTAINKNGQYQLAANGALYISNDYGITWQIIPGLNAKWNISINSSGQYQAVANDYGYIYVSNDYGTTWTQITSIPSQLWWGISINEDGKQMIAAAHNDYLYASNDYGQTWSINSNFKAHWWWCAMDYSGRYRLAVSTQDVTVGSLLPTDGYVYVSDDYGLNWNKVIASGMSGHDWWLCGMDKTGRFMMVGHDHVIYTSWDYGQTWTQEEDLDIKDQAHMGMSGDGLYQVIGDSQPFAPGNNNNFYSLKRKLGIIPINNNGKTICGETILSDTIPLSTYPLYWLSTENGVISVYDIDLCSIYDYYNYKDDFPRIDDCDPLNSNYIQGAGCINWNDEWTTFNRSISDINDWMGNENEFQNIIEYTLLNGLQINTINVCDLKD